MVENTKGVIKSRKPKKNSQYNGQEKKKTKEQSIMGKTIHKQTKDRAPGTPLNRGVNAYAPEG